MFPSLFAVYQNLKKYLQAGFIAAIQVQSAATTNSISQVNETIAFRG